MDIITLDVETFYAPKYSLSGLTIPEYLFDERFLIQGVGIQINDGEPEYFPEQEVNGAIDELDLENSTLVLQNAKFDASILAWKFQRHAARYADTMDLSRAYWPGQNASLEAVCKRLWPHDPSMWKGKELASFKGFRELDEDQQVVMGGYCEQDVRLTYAIYRELIERIPESEVQLAEMTLRMYIAPQLLLDRPRVETFLQAEKATAKALVEASRLPKTTLSSNKQFAEWMRGQGIEVPQKTSPTTGKPTDALGQKDPVFLRTMADHPEHRAVWEARAAVKSTINTTRAQRLLDLDTTLGRIPVPLSFWGAHCVPGDVEVLTPTGWERLDQWQGGPIAQVTEAQEITFERAERYVGPETTRWMVSNARYMPCAFTEGHTIPYLQHGTQRWSTLKAAEASARSSVRVPISGSLCSTGQYTPEMMRVFAMAQADGSFCEDSAQSRQFTVFVKKSRKIQRAHKLLSGAGVPYRTNEFPSHPGYVRFTVAYRDYPEWFSSRCKLFGPWLLDSTPEAREAFITELVHWDGYTYNGKQHYTSSIRENAEWVTTLCHLTSRAATIYTKPANNRGGYIRKEHYEVGIRQRSYAQIKHTHWEAVSQHKRTYCTITKTGFWLARSNGHIFVTGNTGRWSGTQKVNMQNMPRGGELRKSLVAPTGWKVHVADSSNIEARMLAWLAGQMDLLEDFRLKRDAYSKMASKIYGYEVDRKEKDDHGVPTDRFKEEGNVGKTATLGLGYGMGAPKFRHTLAAGPMGSPPILVSDQFAQRAVDTYRGDNPMIVNYWSILGRVAYDMLLPGTDYWVGPIRVRHERLEMPNGMALKYPNLRVVDETDADGNPNGRTQLICDRKNNTTQKLYGGILAENCIAHGTPVLTQRGWIPIQGVQTTDVVHDGIDWVHHEGLIAKGSHPCTIIDGVYMTPDHEVLTNEGWQAASQDPRPYRPAIRQADIPLPIDQRRQKTQMGPAMRLRHSSGTGRYGRRKGLATRVHTAVSGLYEALRWGTSQDTRHEQAPRIRRLALHDRPLPSALASSLAQLRRTRDYGMRAMAELRGILGGYGPELCTGAHPGQGGQRGAVLPRKLSLGGLQGPGGESPNLAAGRHCQGTRTDWNQQKHAVLPLVPQPVYDIRNAGPRSRFVVRGDAGPFIVHNCTQALSRIVVSDQILAAADAFPDSHVVLAVHDEIVMLMPDDDSEGRQQRLEELMRVPPVWAPDLPLDSEGGFDDNYSK